MVARRDVGDPLPDLLDDPGALVPEHGGERARDRAVDDGQVGVAYPGRRHPYQHLAHLRRREVHVHHREAVLRVCDHCLHVQVSPAPMRSGERYRAVPMRARVADRPGVRAKPPRESSHGESSSTAQTPGVVASRPLHHSPERGPGRGHQGPEHGNPPDGRDRPACPARPCSRRRSVARVRGTWRSRVTLGAAITGGSPS